MQGLFIYAIGCFVLGLVFIHLGDTFLGLAVCAAGPFWLAVAHHKETKDEDEEDY
jgi:succinate-acetate transporter protein